MNEPLGRIAFLYRGVPAEFILNRNGLWTLKLDGKRDERMQNIEDSINVQYRMRTTSPSIPIRGGQETKEAAYWLSGFMGVTKAKFFLTPPDFDPDMIY